LTRETSHFVQFPLRLVRFPCGDFRGCNGERAFVVHGFQIRLLVREFHQRRSELGELFLRFFQVTAHVFRARFPQMRVRFSVSLLRLRLQCDALRVLLSSSSRSRGVLALVEVQPTLRGFASRVIRVFVQPRGVGFPKTGAGRDRLGPAGRHATHRHRPWLIAA